MAIQRSMYTAVYEVDDDSMAIQQCVYTAVDQLYHSKVSHLPILCSQISLSRLATLTAR